MSRWVRGAAAAASLLSADAACAQIVFEAPAKRAADVDRYRMPALGRMPRGARDHVPATSFQRRSWRANRLTLASLRGEAPTLSFDASPRSRVTLLRVDDSVAIGDRLTATIGWQGLKVSNRNANAASGGSDRLTARDWFLPHMGLSLRPTPRLTVALGYHETMRAYEGAGSAGPLGLTRDAFALLRNGLRPERTRQWWLDGAWATPDLRLAIGGFRAALSDPLAFADGSDQPGNGASATLSGVRVAAEQRLTRRLSWSGSYLRATRRQTGLRGREAEITVGGVWRSGAWRGLVSASRDASASLGSAAPRIEAGIDYESAGIAGRPLHLSARMTDPGRLASTRLADDTGAVRATDRARGMMLTATMAW